MMGSSHKTVFKGDRQAACRDENLNTLKIHWCIIKKSRGGISMLKNPQAGVCVHTIYRGGELETQ